tara:strand:- start:46 stop:597 length:552 start_codon:yes stop_codon:yes gene_type:complete
MITSSLFNIPIWTKEIPNFQDDMKQKLLELLLDYPEKRNGTQRFYTNRQSDTPNFTNRFSEIISTELTELKQSIYQVLHKDIELNVKDVWSVTYENGDYQKVHNHSSTGLTGILYIDNPDDGPNLDILQPYDSWLSGKTQFLSIKFKGGSIVVFPSFLKHSTEPNTSKQMKKVIGWDMTISEK